MHFSRVRVDLNGLARNELFAVMGGEPYGTHQLLWRLFPDYDGPRPFLFRQEVEEGADGEGRCKGLPLFYLLSEQTPVAIPGLLEVESKPFAPRLDAGETLAFRLRANPTVSHRVEGQKHSRRSDVLMHAKSAFAPEQRGSQACKDAMDLAARQWLAGQGEKHGFVLRGAPEISGYRQHSLGRKKQTKPIQFSGVDYNGTLEITDAEAFGTCVAQGLGRSKAFGFGMMMIRRA
ncbi:type I-E CRISPR-associated protein Cas6/Cse3/CasE [Alloalcanivorax marinus]|uniref:type I-E CRISPR-associated protein Cas6/Cse3/CasE n=1 Tax=Alloalcanivorax marinus TaxID=1177169 RepID=UPI0021D094D2|nr:type I-E CRISPR-associated protein Cas6/Cse3/CasE [Alloalcanivorax marinus]MCU5787333.1 CRISPR-associated Cse3 family protein [Alloalcanivorax marinus]